MIKDLRHLSFEIAPSCNLSATHKFCPINDSLRYPVCEGKDRCPDEAIVRFSSAAHKERGFQGLVGFHYYCDPLVDTPRMLHLIHLMKQDHPDTRFVLWTNGHLFKNSCRNWLSVFEKVIVTLHDPSKRKYIEKCVAGAKNVSIEKAIYDERSELYDAPVGTAGKCARPFTIELPVNYYGWVRLCCGEYRGRVSIGNIVTEEPQKVLDYFEEAAEEAQAGTLSVCKQCKSLKVNPAVI